VQIEGPNGVVSADRLRPKEQRILARLGLQPGRVVLRDELLDTFWTGSKVVLAERSLRTVVSSLRGAIRSVLDEPSIPLIRGRMDGYCLEEPAFAVDVSHFVDAVQEARGASDGDEPSDRALAAWQRAIDLYQGDLLSAFRYDDWCLAIRERLRDDYLDGLFLLARVALTRGEPERARELAARMVEMEPAEERAHRLLMRCYALLGRPAEAVRQFERCRAALDEELAARPAAATLALLETIHAGAALGGEERG
jgi:DNA-binding SARP family transcriptional activator